MTAERLRRLSRIKEQREDRARNALQRRLAALAAALDAARRAAEEETAFRALAERRRAEVYASALGNRLSVHRLERINLQVAELERQVGLRRQAVEKAEAHCREARTAVEAARRELAARHRDNQKWAKLTDRVEEKARRAADFKAELEIGDDLADRHASGHGGRPGLGGGHD